MSKNMKVASRSRLALHAMTDGRCFYCGIHLTPDVYVLRARYGRSRDWLVPGGNGTLIGEHKTPLIRGGNNHIENLTPSCARCNASKNELTLEEFRLKLGLRLGVMPHIFACESNIKPRDYIVICSEAFIRPLISHNFPDLPELGRGRGMRIKARWQAYAERKKTVVFGGAGPLIK